MVDTRRRNLDGSRRGSLVSVCSADLGNASQWAIQLHGIVWSALVDARAPGRVCCGDTDIAKNGNGCPGLALRVRLVFSRATTIACRDAGGNERERLAKDSSRMGTDFQYLLEVLVRVDRVGRRLPLDSWDITQKAMAGLARSN